MTSRKGTVMSALIHHLIGSRNNEVTIAKYPKIIIWLLILFLILTPPLFSIIFTRTWLSPFILGTFLRELIISILIVAGFVVFSKVWDFIVDKLTPLILVSSYNEMLRAAEVKSISGDEMSSVQLIQSLKKWIWQQNETGWFEIQEITQGKKLNNQVAILLVKQELYRVQQNLSYGVVHSKDRGYSAKLKSLLPSNEMKTLNQIIQDFDEGYASEDDVKRAMVVNYFNKWIYKDDETGWVAIDDIWQDEQPLTVELAKLELRRLEEVGKENYFVSKIDKLRLKSLLMN